jgi:predicted HicB family RNase H-like nuclease
MSPKTVRGKGKRYPLNMRTTKELRDRLEAAAKRSGRSLVQEVEYRLGMSFAEEDWHEKQREELEALSHAGDLLKEVRDLRARVARMEEQLPVEGQHFYSPTTLGRAARKEERLSKRDPASETMKEASVRSQRDELERQRDELEEQQRRLKRTFTLR